MVEPLLDIANLTVDIATPRGTLHAVRGISLRVDAGETLCIVGESGCGKSMTALSLMGLLPKAASLTADQMSFAGKPMRTREGRSLIGDRIAMIFQEPMTALNPVFRIGDQLTEGYRQHKKASKAEALERARHLFQKVGIANPDQRLQQFPHQLSGGLRQRVMIAMALMCGPDLIVADEPTTALDVTIQVQILRLLAELKQELNLALLLITHDLGLVARIADRVAVMYAGEIVETGTAAAIFAHPRHPYTRGLMACIPVPGRTAPGGRLGAIAGNVPSLIGDIEGCAFRDRCPLAGPDCAVPVLLAGEADHVWRCLREEI